MNPNPNPSATTTDDPVVASLTRLVGQRIPGGCDECDAYQEVHELAPRVFVNTVRHDDDCEFLARYEARQARREKVARIHGHRP